MIVIIAFLVGYLVLSLIIGLLDLLDLHSQDRYFDNIPIGDIGYYEEPREILGAHNWIFIPSWLVILPFLNK